MCFTVSLNRQRSDHKYSLFILSTALFGGNSRLVDAKPIIFTGAEGGNGTVTCTFDRVDKWKFFCRNECKGDNILIKTDATIANNGKYRIQYKQSRSGTRELTATITNLVQSDAGHYSCGVGSTSVPESFEHFEVKVSDGEFLRALIKTNKKMCVCVCPQI